MADHTAAEPETGEAATTTTAETQDVVTQDASTGADSSPATPDAKPEAEPKKTTLDIVREVVAKQTADKTKDGNSSEASKPESTSATPEPKSAKADATPATKEKDPPFHKHPRWIELQNKAKTAEARVAELEPKLQEYEADATEHRSIKQFMQVNALGVSDVVKLLQVGALIRNQPEQAITALESTLAELRAFIGDTIPADLQAEVERGEITEERARELSRARSLAARSTTAATQTAEARAADDARAKQKANNEKLSETITAWESEQRTSDPAFDKKQSLIQDRVAAVLAQQRAKGKTMFSPQDARQIMDQAKKYVDAQIAAHAPPKPAVRAVRTGGAPAPRSSTPATGKTSVLDVVRSTYEAGRG